MEKESSWTEDLQEDFYAWMADIEADIEKGNIKDIEDSVSIVGNLPKFVQGWTVKELVAAVMDR